MRDGQGHVARVRAAYSMEVALRVHVSSNAGDFQGGPVVAQHSATGRPAMPQPQTPSSVACPYSDDVSTGGGVVAMPARHTVFYCRPAGTR